MGPGGANSGDLTIPATRAIGLVKRRKVRILGPMNASLTDLHRNIAKVLRPVIHGKETVSLFEHGKEVARIIPVRSRADRQQALEDLLAIGPIELPSRG